MTVMMTANEPAGSIAEITSIVHDLRNPLFAIHGSAEILIHSRLSKRQVHRIARNMYGASVRMKELLDELLTRSRGAGKGVEPSDLREQVARAVDEISVVAESQSVQIVQDVPENLVIAVDRQRIQRVLVNLFVNALDVMPNGGTIRVSAVLEQDSVLIKVRDTGPGIAAEIRERLFQPFATAGKASGPGLGLFFSRQVVIYHGGEMWAESSPRGACFAVRLPLGDPRRTRLMLIPLAQKSGVPGRRNPSNRRHRHNWCRTKAGTEHRKGKRYA